MSFFRDPHHQLQYERDGYVVVPLLSQAECQIYLERHHGLPKVSDDGFFSVMHATKQEYKTAVHSALLNLGEKACGQLLLDYRPLVAGFVTKQPGPESAVPPHQDWNLVDETQFTSFNVWCPLVDTNKHNGALHVLRGSHRLPVARRGSLSPNHLDALQHLNCETMTCLPVQAGQAVIYDFRLIHASPPNLSTKIRIAAAVAVVPVGAPTIHFFFNPESGKLETWSVDEDFFKEYYYGRNQRPEGVQVISTCDPCEVIFTDRELESMLEVPPSRLPKPPYRSDRVFRDDSLETQLRRDGYVIVTLLEPSELAQLRAVYESTPGKPADGFSPGITSPNMVYKLACHQGIVQVLAPKVEELLHEYEYLIGSFATKHCGPASSMGAHQDFTVVDETKHTSVSFWCPLDDVNADNGALSVLPGSHALKPVRGQGLPFSCSIISDLPHEEFKCLPMKAGQVLIYAHSLIHRSGPNQSGRLRLAAMMAAIPKSAEPIMHFQGAEPGLIDIYEAPTDFFLQFAFGDSPRPTWSQKLGSFRAEIAPLSMKQVRPFTQSGKTIWGRLWRRIFP